MPIRILYISENNNNFEQIKALLNTEELSIDIHIAASNSYSFKNSIEFYDLILLDLEDIEHKCFDICKEIRAMLSDIPIITFIDFANSAFLKKALDAGINDFINRPVKKIELIARINNIIKIQTDKKKLKTLFTDLKNDFALASNLQKIFIKDWVNILDDTLVTSTYIPFTGVSGDLFNYLRISENKFLIYIGDISGHGLQASLIMSAIQTLIRVEIANTKGDIDIIHVLNNINNFFIKNFKQINYMTFMLGILDYNTKELTYFSAGHPPLIVYDPENKSAVFIKEKGSIPIGLFSGIDYDYEFIDKISINDNSILLMYTDGLFEFIDENSQKNTPDTLLKIINSVNFTSTATFQDEIISVLKRKNYIFDDDITICIFSKINKNNNCLSIAFDPLLSNVSKILKSSTDFFEKNNIDMKISYSIELMLAEILNNIIIHGYENKADKFEKIYLSIYIEKGEYIIITTLDKSKKWNICDKISTHTSTDDNDNLKVSGRGVDIINSIVDNIQYKRIAELNKNIYKIDIQQEIN